VIFTIPEQLRKYFEASPQLLSDIVRAAVETLEEVMSQAAGKKLKIGVIAVIQTSGRASNYNPHIHMMVTSGGIDENGKWVEINWIKFGYLHKQWQKHLFEVVERQVFGSEIKTLLEELRQKYSFGVVVYWEKKPVKTGKGLAKYLIKYVVSPPIAVRRITEYNGEEVEYYWQDHKSSQQEKARVSVIEFIRRLVQHILPKGFHRVRYFGLHATCLRVKITETIRKAIGAVSQLAFFFGEVIFSKLSWRAKMMAKFGHDPLKCDNCGDELLLWKIWSSTHGTIFYFPDDSPDWVEPNPLPKQPESVQLSFSF
jgi:Putative transposase